MNKKNECSHAEYIYFRIGSINMQIASKDLDLINCLHIAHEAKIDLLSL